MSLNNDATLSDVIQAQNTYFENLTHRVYGYNHTDFAVRSIDTVYEELIEETPALEALSAVGFTALLKDGDTVPVIGRTFINGTEETADYTFSAANSTEGRELVSVWYFENNGALNVTRGDIKVIEISVKSVNAVPTFSTDFFDYADSVTTNMNLTSAPAVVKKQKNIRGGEITDNVATVIEEYENYGTVFPLSSKKLLCEKTTLKRVKFPYLEKIYGGSSSALSFICGCKNCTDIQFPSLKRIENTAVANYSSPFLNVPYITLPESVEYVGNDSFYGNGSIQLDCPDAVFTNTWCRKAPSVLFSMCSDWGATINIATAAANWIKDDFLDLFENKLRDMDDDVREIKIPSAIYDSLTDEEFALAEDKGWTVGC